MVDVYALARQRRPAQLTMGMNPFDSPHQQNGTATTRPTPARGAPLYRPSNVRYTISARNLAAAGYPNLYGKENQQPKDDAEVLFSGLATGPPSKLHWKPDSAAVKCSMACCPREFGLFERRHHCRRCGDIFCSTHGSHYIRLDENSNFNLAGFASRVCDRCYEEYIRLLNKCKKAGRTSEVYDLYAHTNRKQHRDSGYYTSSGPSSAESNDIPNVRSRSYRKIEPQREAPLQINQQRRPLVDVNYNLSPMPADWAWSTF